LRFIGDIHGKISEYVKIANDSPDGKSIQVGDFGMGFDIKYRELINLKGKHYFIRGNHDSPDVCKQYKDSPYLKWIPDGRMTTGLADNSPGNKKSCLFIGGAFSIDRQRRLEGVSWWPDEQLSYKELNKIIRKVEKIKKPLDIIVSHDCPESFCYNLDADYRNFSDWNSVTRHALQMIWDINKPKMWIHGHWHIQNNVVVNGTEFNSLAELGYIDVEW